MGEEDFVKKEEEEKARACGEETQQQQQSSQEDEGEREEDVIKKSKEEATVNISHVCEIYENQLCGGGNSNNAGGNKKGEEREDFEWEDEYNDDQAMSWWPFSSQRSTPASLCRETFTDEKGSVVYKIKEDTLRSEFEVDLCREVGEGGWEYALDFSSKFDKESMSGAGRARVRRRCWVRKTALETANIDLLPGERVQAFSNRVLLALTCASQSGSLCLTNYRLCMVETFDSDNQSSDSIGNYEEISSDPEAGNKVLFQIPLCIISQIQRRESFESEKYEEIFLNCKDFRTLSLNFMKGERRLFFDRLRSFAFPDCFGKEMFAFTFGASENKKKYPMDGWRIYDAFTEYKRQGLDSFPQWSLSNINQSYEFCDSYPDKFIVPSNLTKEQLQEIGKFRSNSRIPVATWIHPSTGFAVLRSGQPLTGMRWQSSSADEALLSEIASSSGKLFVLDARPRTNALFNQLMGGGYEDTSAMDNIDLDFCGIGNIHVMRDSLGKIQNMIYQGIDDEHWLSNLEKSQWLHNIKSVLTAANRIARTLERASVLIHCSDGWDRSSQLSALAMLFLDPYYRTIIGFEVLIEKEWLSFGHKFHQRLGHSNVNSFDREISPIFLQFIDCVWQALDQFPHAFEFTEKFLITILDEMYSCRFGTFLFNSERERKQHDLQGRTVSLWSHIDTHTFVNVEYSVYVGSLLPVAKISNLKFWSSYYLRYQQ
eukprot:Nk52_evm35s805 gene=Nk52_evmTU35s805